MIEELAAEAGEGLLSTTSGRFFGWVIGGALPVSVAADWLTSAWDQNAAAYSCSPAVAILEEVVGDYAGKLKIAKLNIDENPNTPPKFGIRGIPTLILYKDGDVEATKVGALSKSQLTAFIDSNL